MIHHIAHPTDFSPASAKAFAHALRLALEYKCQLDLLHVKSPDDEEWSSFPRLCEILARWGQLPANARHADVESKLGLRVQKVEITHQDAVTGIVEFLADHRPELIVTATHGRTGLNRWLSGSISQSVARKTHLPTLFVGPKARSFVNCETGALQLNAALVPVAPQPSPRPALRAFNRLFKPLPVDLRLVHNGDRAPWILNENGEPYDVRLIAGPVVKSILQAADELTADLIAMPTAGPHGFLDALRGTTTEHVLQHGRYALLAMPATPNDARVDAQ